MSKTRLTRDDWTAAALTALAEAGLAAVAIEPLAAKLGATKGSGYWHFANRAALVQATLDRWERDHTDLVIAQIDEQAGPSDKLRNLLHSVVGRSGPQTVELSLLAVADDPVVGPVLKRVTLRRIGYVTDLFRELGLDQAQAAQRALLAYTTYLGHAQLARIAPDAVPSGEARTIYLDAVFNALI